MKRYRKVFAGIAIASAVALVWIALPQSGPRPANFAGDGLFTPALAGDHRGGHHFRGRGLGQVCSDARSQKVEDVIGFVDAFFMFTPEQAAAWDELVAAVRGGDSKIGTHCGTLKDAGRPSTAPERLALMRTLLAAGLDLVETVYPPFDRFYSSLDAEQQEAIDKLFTWRGMRGHGAQSSR